MITFGNVGFHINVFYCSDGEKNAYYRINRLLYGQRQSWYRGFIRIESLAKIRFSINTLNIIDCRKENKGNAVTVALSVTPVVKIVCESKRRISLDRITII